MKNNLIFAFLILLTLSIKGQVIDEERLPTIRTQAEQCNKEGLIALDSLITHQYNVMAPQKKYRANINKMINCSKEIGQNNQLASAYSSLFLYHYDYSSLDSLLYATKLLNELYLIDNSREIDRYNSITKIWIGSYYYYKLDDVEKAYSYYVEALDEYYTKGHYDHYLLVVKQLANYYSDDEEYQKAITTIDEHTAKLPDPQDVNAFVNTDMNVFNRISSDLKILKATSILYDNDSEKDKIHEAYLILSNYVSKSKDTNPYNSLMSINYILDRVSHLPLDTLVSYGELGISIDKQYGYNDNYIRTFHSENLIKSGKLTEAKYLLEEALTISKGKPNYYYEIAQIYNSLATIDLKKSGQDDVRLLFDKHITYMDSTYRRRKKNDIEIIETKYELIEKEAQNQLIQQKQATLKQRFTLLAIGGSLLLISLILSLFFYQRMRKNASLLASLNEKKNKLFAIIAHDLRTPIMGLSNLAENVEYLSKQNKIEALSKYAKEADSRVKALDQNLDSLLLWAVKESNLISKKTESVKMRTIVQSIIDLYSEQIKLKNIRIENSIPELAQVDTDIAVLRTLVRNLVSNAIKFSHTYGNIKFSISDDNDQVKLLVADSGIGINTSKIEESEENQRLRETMSGSGIGLKICNELAEKSGILFDLIPNPTGGTIGLIAIAK